MLIEKDVIREDEKKNKCSCYKRKVCILIQVLVLVILLVLFISSSNSQLVQGKVEVNLNGKSIGPSGSMFKGHRLSFHDNYCSKVVKEHNLAKASSSGALTPGFQSYTIVVSTYDRDYELIKNLDHWLSCPNIYQVQVLWHNPDRKPPQLLQQMEEEYDCSDYMPEHFSDSAPSSFNYQRLKIRVQTENKLTNRFRTPVGGFATEAVFNVDDDAILDCRLMKQGFEKWVSLGVSSMVGYEPRQIDWSTSSEDQGYTWYASCEEGSCEYNTLWPTKGAFLHKSLYEVYFSDEYKTPRELVDNYLTGEDILMTYVHYSTFLRNSDSRKPPPILAIQAKSDFQRQFFNYHERFSLSQKARLLPGYLGDLFYIDELGSLGLRSSWFRFHITESIGQLAKSLTQELQEKWKMPTKDFMVPPMVKTWFFVANDLSGQESSEVCENEALFKSLRCTTYTSLYPLSFSDVGKMLLPLLFVVIVVLGLVRFLRYRRLRANYEAIKQRKVSGVDFSDFYDHS